MEQRLVWQYYVGQNKIGTTDRRDQNSGYERGLY